jgi:hypothetical protein
MTVEISSAFDDRLPFLAVHELDVVPDDCHGTKGGSSLAVLPTGVNVAEAR